MCKKTIYLILFTATIGMLNGYVYAADLFSDDFESGDLTTGGWTVSGDAAASNKADYSGIYGARIPLTSSIEKSISTVGYTTIHVKFYRKTVGMDSGEYLYAEWHDGNSWNTLESTQETDWGTQKDFTCPSGADNNANFKIRFRASTNKGNEYGCVDVVIVSGTSSQTDTDPPTPNPATFVSPPAAISDTEITMTATTGSDPSGPVQYFFDETSGNPGATDSGWVT
ncbi:MAG: hypothetical protein ACYSWP_08010, partial [Planctomycetota bacterium]